MANGMDYPSDLEISSDDDTALAVGVVDFSSDVDSVDDSNRNSNENLMSKRVGGAIEKQEVAVSPKHQEKVKVKARPNRTRRKKEIIYNNLRRRSQKIKSPPQKEDLNQEFELEVRQVDIRINELGEEIERLERPTLEVVPGSENAHVNHFNEIAVIESKIIELQEQKASSKLGFERIATDDFHDSMRKRREIFRLKTRLPALAKRKEFEEIIRSKKFLVVMGHTGSGKSTQLVQYLADMPEFLNKTIICTQPRKIAAISLAKRVGYEFMGGRETPEAFQWVGYHVGGIKRLHPHNRIQFMTETVLLNQLGTSEQENGDPFSNCCAVIVDEAHCRSISTDILLGVLKRKISQWPNLRLIVTSATIDTQLFSDFLFRCPVIEIPGRLYPVEVIYKPFDQSKISVVEASVKQALDICSDHTSGHVLCFLTGQKEVETAKERFAAAANFAQNRLSKIVPCALYGKQTPEEQQKVFVQRPGEQKVIFSTDIAETSITIDGVKFIVDCGLAKTVVYDSVRNMTSLKEMMISAASAEQRKGRAGRTGHGTCYRLYSEEDHKEMPSFDKAELFQRPLAITFTLLKAMRVDPFTFEWLESPEPGALEGAVEELTLVGALDHQRNLTELGRLISDLQIDPSTARMIQYACLNGFGKLATHLAGLLSVSSMVFWRGGDEESVQKSDLSKQQFIDKDGDIYACLTVFNKWMKHRKQDKSQKGAKKWCMQNYINNKALNMALTTAKEIETTLTRSAPELWQLNNRLTREASIEDIRRLISYALMLNVALKVNKNLVALRSNVLTYVHPSSAYFEKNGEELPDVVVYQYILCTSRTFAVHITPIDLNWIKEESSALHALYEERRLNVNVHEVKIEAVSPSILRDIVGPGNRHIDKLNTELDCFINADFDRCILVAWCKFTACADIKMKLNELVEIRKAKLRAEVQETPIYGDTRVVWGCGGKGTQILGTGEFVSIRASNISADWPIDEIEGRLRAELDQPIEKAITSVVVLTDARNLRTKHVAQIVFSEPESAMLACQRLTEKFHRSAIQFRPILTNAPSTFKEFEAWLDVSFATALSQRTAILMYKSMADANEMLSLRMPFIARPLRPRQNNIHDPALPYNRDPLVINGRFVEQQNPFQVKMIYGLFVNQLASNLFDEDDIEQEIRNYNGPKPFYIKVNRRAEINIPGTPNMSYEESCVRYTISKNILPIPHKIKEKLVRRDEKKKKITIRAKYETSDDLEMIFSSGLDRISHCSEPVRMKPTFKTSLRIEKKFWPFRGQQIEEYLKRQRTRDFSYKIDSRSPINVWIHVEVNRMESLHDVRKNIDQLLQFSYYKNEFANLLFTTYGREKIKSFDVQKTFIHTDFYSKSVRIYGDPDEQNKAKSELDEMVKALQTLQHDVLFRLKKSKMTRFGKNLKQYYNDGLRGELKIVVNRLYATGTQEGIETLNGTIKEFLLEQKHQVEIGECWLCFCELDDPYCLQLCAHKFCTGCIKSMFHTQSIEYPIVCPAENCGQEICLKDVKNIAPTNAIETIAQLATASLLQTHPTKYRKCFKMGCEQVLVLRNREVKEEDESGLGGCIIRCDFCHLDYCIKCSTKTKSPIERHRGMSCAQSLSGLRKEARFHRLFILDEICVLRCPRCKTAFIDFEGCCALFCSMSGCKAAFCFFCLEDCGNDAHSHVRQCPKNPNRNQYYISPSKKNSIHKESRKRSVVQYLMSQCKDLELREEVLESLEKDLKDLEIVINRNEVGLSKVESLSNRNPRFTSPIGCNQFSDIYVNRIQPPAPLVEIQAEPRPPGQPMRFDNVPINPERIRAARPPRVEPNIPPINRQRQKDCTIL